jgi:hypothetical protein
VALLSLSALATHLALPAQWAVCTDAGGRFVATVFGVINTASAAGAALSPLAAGYLLSRLASADALGNFDPAARAHAWDVALAVFVAASAASTLFWLRIDADESLVG